MSVKIHPSILNADHDNMQAEFDRLVEAGADGIHLDIMDGKFVKQQTFAIRTVEDYVEMCELPFDAHLMIVDPEDYVDDYIHAGVDLVNFHLEATEEPEELIYYLHNSGVQAGVTINPDTPVDGLYDVAHQCDLVLFMSVYPGLGGQDLIPEVLDKMRDFKRFCVDIGLSPMIQIDGGINLETAARAAAAGADNIVAGTFIMKSPDYGETIRALREACDNAEPDY